MGVNWYADGQPRYPVEYGTRRALHTFRGDGDICEGCGEHADQHPKVNGVVVKLPMPNKREPINPMPYINPHPSQLKAEAED